MGGDDELVTYLNRLGLSLYEAKAYIGLVSSGAKTASEISVISGVPRPKVYSTVRNLERKGLVKIIPGRPDVFTALPPERHLYPAVEKMKEEARRCEEAVSTLMLKYEVSRHIGTGPSYELRNIWPIPDRENVVKRLEDLASESEKAINMIATRNGVLRLYKRGVDILESSALRGVKIRLLAPYEDRDKWIVHELGEILEMRRLSGVPEILHATFDSRKILFVEVYPDDLNPRLGGDRGFWIDNSNLATLQDRVFEEVWRRAKTEPG
ncbi:MAG: helix-turn-helix domain-containing protein [Candidatus Bathyarchaeia archaeon]